MPLHTSAGTQLYIGGNGPLESEAAFVLVGEVVDLGEFGPAYELITHSSLDNRNVRKFKGTRNDGSMTFNIGRVAEDSGQADMIAARDSDLAFNFKVEENDDPGGTGSSPTTHLFQAKVMQFATNIGDANTLVQASAVLEIDSGTYSVADAVAGV